MKLTYDDHKMYGLEIQDDVCRFFLISKVNRRRNRMEIIDIRLQHNVVRFPKTKTKQKCRFIENRIFTCPSRPILTGLFSFHELIKCNV